MRVLNVVWLFPCSSETFISLILADLTRRGWHMDILSQRDPRTWEGKAREDTEPETQIHAHVVEAGLLDRVSYFGTAQMLNQRLTEHDGAYDLVFLHWADFLEQILSRQPLSVPVVVTCHEPDFTQSLPIFMERERVLERVSGIIVEGRYQYEKLLELGYPAERLLYWKVGLDFQGIDAAFTAHHLTTDTLRLVSAGRFVEKKGFLQTIEAIADLRDRGLSLEYNLIGDGELRSEIERLIGHYGLDQIVRLPGKIMHPALFEHLARGHINLIPSGMAADGDVEGLMSTVLEAMACGSAIVGTRHGGTPEVIKHAVTGWLLDDNNPHTIAAAIEYLANNPDLRQQLGAAGRAFVLEHFKLEATIDILEAFLNEVKNRSQRFLR